MTREEAIRWMIVERSYIREVDGNDGGRLLIEAYDMAIEALKAKTDGDLISRQDAIEAVRNISENYTGKGKRDYHPHVDFIIDELKYVVPSAESAQGWIPVSEKPKDENRTYLVQLDSGGMRSCRWTNANPIWTELTTDWHWNIFDIPQYCKVVAWMDLEPYREDGE